MSEDAHWTSDELRASSYGAATEMECNTFRFLVMVRLMIIMAAAAAVVVAASHLVCWHLPVGLLNLLIAYGHLLWQRRGRGTYRKRPHGAATRGIGGRL